MPLAWPITSRLSSASRRWRLDSSALMNVEALARTTAAWPASARAAGRPSSSWCPAQEYRLKRAQCPPAQREREGPDRREAEVGGDRREGRPPGHRERNLHLGTGHDGFDATVRPRGGTEPRRQALTSAELALVVSSRLASWATRDTLAASTPGDRHRQVDNDVQQAGTVGPEGTQQGQVGPQGGRRRRPVGPVHGVGRPKTRQSTVSLMGDASGAKHNKEVTKTGSGQQK